MNNLNFLDSPTIIGLGEIISKPKLQVHREHQLPRRRGQFVLRGEAAELRPRHARGDVRPQPQPGGQAQAHLRQRGCAAQVGAELKYFLGLRGKKYFLCRIKVFMQCASNFYTNLHEIENIFGIF